MAIFEIDNKLTPQRRVLLEKPTVAELEKKFPSFYGIRKFVTIFIGYRNPFHIHTICNSSCYFHSHTFMSSPLHPVLNDLFFIRMRDQVPHLYEPRRKLGEREATART
jgi:hypothetical protein